MTIPKPPHATAHIPAECDDCDHRAHLEYEGTGCWCPICICPNAVGSNDSDDRVLCPFCVSTLPGNQTEVGTIRHILSGEIYAVRVNLQAGTTVILEAAGPLHHTDSRTKDDLEMWLDNNEGTASEDAAWLSRTYGNQAIPFQTTEY